MDSMEENQMNPREPYDVFENEIYMNGGFTYSPSFGFLRDTPESKEIFNGYIVSVKEVYKLQRDIKPAELSSLINEAHRRGLLIGGWLHEGIRYWELSRQFDSLEDALEDARSRNEIAIFDCSSMEEIKV